MMNIIVDSREQKPLWDENCTVAKLDAGDYSIEGYEDCFSIERKSLGDLYGTFGKGHKRFRRELERAEKLEYFGIVIEGSYTDCLHKNFVGAQYSRMKGKVITAILFTLHVKYRVPFFFAKDREESRKIIKELMKAFIKMKEEEAKDAE